MASERRIVGGAVGIVLVPIGFLLMWGGLSGNLAAILAAIFAPDQLTKTSGVSQDNAPSFPIPVIPIPGASPSGSTPGEVANPNTGQIENPPAEGEIVPPEQLGTGTPQLPAGSEPIPGEPFPELPASNLPVPYEGGLPVA